MGKMIVKVVDGRGNVISRNEMTWDDRISGKDYTKKEKVCGVKITRDNGDVLVDTTSRKGDFNRPHFKNNHGKANWQKKNLNNNKNKDKVANDEQPKPSIEKALENIQKQEEQPKEGPKKKVDKKALKQKLNNIAKNSLEDDHNYYDEYSEYEDSPSHEKIIKSNRKGE